MPRSVGAMPVRFENDGRGSKQFHESNWFADQMTQRERDLLGADLWADDSHVFSANFDPTDLDGDNSQLEVDRSWAENTQLEVDSGDVGASQWDVDPTDNDNDNDSVIEGANDNDNDNVEPTDNDNDNVDDTDNDQHNDFEECTPTS